MRAVRDEVPTGLLFLSLNFADEIAGDERFEPGLRAAGAGGRGERFTVVAHEIARSSCRVLLWSRARIGATALGAPIRKMSAHDARRSR